MHDQPDLSSLLNARFAIQHLVIRTGYDTPDHFICPKGLRPWSRFFCLQNGTVVFHTDDGRDFTVFPGDILYLPHNITYTSGWIEKENGWYYSIEFILTSAKSPALVFSEAPLVVSRGADPEYSHMIREMYTAWNGGAAGYWMRCCELFLRFMQMTAGRIGCYGHNDSCGLIREGILFLESNYTKDVTTSQLAGICSMSESNFRKLFRKYSELSPIAYRNLLRMKRAKELLETGLYTVNEAAAIVNVSDPFYFNKMFRRHFGIPPSGVIPGSPRR